MRQSHLIKQQLTITRNRKKALIISISHLAQKFSQISLQQELASTWRTSRRQLTIFQKVVGLALKNFFWTQIKLTSSHLLEVQTSNMLLFNRPNFLLWLGLLLEEVSGWVRILHFHSQHIVRVELRALIKDLINSWITMGTEEYPLI